MVVDHLQYLGQCPSHWNASGANGGCGDCVAVVGDVGVAAAVGAVIGPGLGRNLLTGVVVVVVVGTAVAVKRSERKEWSR